MMWLPILGIGALHGAPGTALPPEIVCDGQYTGHLQGIAGNGVDTIYWSFTYTVVKTDLDGRILASVDGPYHHGDLCLAGDKLYVAWSNKFNEAGADSKVYIYNADDLSLLKVVPVPVPAPGDGMPARPRTWRRPLSMPASVRENGVGSTRDIPGVTVRRRVRLVSRRESSPLVTSTSYAFPL